MQHFAYHGNDNYQPSSRGHDYYPQNYNHQGGVYHPTNCVPPISHVNGGFGTNLREASFQTGQASNAFPVAENTRLAHRPGANRVSLGVDSPLAGSTSPIQLPDSAALKHVENNIPNEPYYPVVKAPKKDNWTPQVDESLDIMKTNDEMGELLKSCEVARSKGKADWLSSQPINLLQSVFLETDAKDYGKKLQEVTINIENAAKDILTRDIIDMAKALETSGTSDKQSFDGFTEAKAAIYAGHGISLDDIQSKMCLFSYVMNIASGKPTLKSISQRVVGKLGMKLSPGLVAYVAFCCKGYKDEISNE